VDVNDSRDYTSLPSIRSVTMSLMDDNQERTPIISPVDNSTAAVSRFSALNDNDKGTKNNPDKQEKDKIEVVCFLKRKFGWYI